MTKTPTFSYPLNIKKFINDFVYKINRVSLKFNLLTNEPKFSNKDIKEFQKLKHMEQLGHKINLDENLGKYYNYCFYDLIKNSELLSSPVIGIEKPINNENEINFSNLKSLFKIIVSLLDSSCNLLALFKKPKHSHLFIYKNLSDELKNPNVFYFIYKFHDQNVLNLSDLTALKSYSSSTNPSKAGLFISHTNKIWFRLISSKPDRDLNNLIFLNYLNNIKKMLIYNKYLIFQIFNSIDLIKIKNPVGYRIRKLFEDINKQRMADGEFNFIPNTSKEKINLDFISRVRNQLDSRLNQYSKEKIYSFYMNDIYNLNVKVTKQSRAAPGLKDLNYWSRRKTKNYPFGELNSTHFVIMNESLDYGVYVIIPKFYSCYWLAAFPIINRKNTKNINKYIRICNNSEENHLFLNSNYQHEDSAGAFLSFFLSFAEEKKLTNPVISLRQGQNPVTYLDFASDPAAQADILKALKSSTFIVPENKLIGNLYGMIPIKSANQPTFDYLMNFIEMAYHHARILCEINNKLENKIQEYETSFIENLIKI